MSSDDIDYVDLLDALVSELRESPAVTVEHAARDPPRGDRPDALRAYPELQAFYEQVDSFELSWILADEGDPDYSGTVEIISSQYFDDGQTPVLLDEMDYWVIDDEERTLDGRFYPLDIIEDNACVGVFDDREMDRSELYYHDFGIEFYGLRVAWPGYVRLLRNCMAVRYWQKAILDREHGIESVEAERVGEILSAIPGAPSVAEFESLYESVKTD